MDKIVAQAEEWKNSNVQVFWGEIAACDHVVQIYEADKIFLDTLEGFAGSGLLAGDSVVIIATATHLEVIKERLRNQGFDLPSLMASDQFIVLEASETLDHFLENNWPNEELFNRFIEKVVRRATTNNRKVRAFGEMVAVLWERGLGGATVQLEKIWCRLHDKNHFSLYCAYPKSGFTQNANDSMHMICAAHSKIVDGKARPSTEIYYKP